MLLYITRVVYLAYAPVCLCYCNKISETGKFIENRGLLSQPLETRKVKVKMLAFGV